MKKTIGSIVKHIVLLVLAVIWLVPIIWLVVTSFSGYKGINTAHFFPTSWSMDNFVQLLTRPDSVVQYVSWFKNTLIIAVFTCIISTIFVIMVSYAMSCMRFNGRKQIMSASLILNMFPGPLLMIAIYFILKMLGLTNSHFGMIIVYKRQANSSVSGNQFFPYTLGRFCIRKAYAQLRSFEGLDSSYRSLQYA